MLAVVLLAAGALALVGVTGTHAGVRRRRWRGRVLRAERRTFVDGHWVLYAPAESTPA